MSPVKRMTLRQAVDYFRTVEDSSDESDSDPNEHDHQCTPAGDEETYRDTNNGEDSDGDVFVLDDNNDESDTTSDGSDDSENEQQLGRHYVSPNGIEWMETRPAPRRLHRNITNFVPGATIIPRNELESFLLLMDESILRTILLHTNRRLRGLKRKCFTFCELKAAIAIMIRAGTDKDNLSCLSSLFNEKDSRPFYRCCMSKNRFREFLRYVTFDNRNTRRSRQVLDKMAAIREVWELLQCNLRKHYVPSEWITVDEQLYAYRGYVPGRAYMKSKPAKYGVKVFWGCDAKNGYALAGELYSGKGNERNVGLAQKIVLSLTEFFQNSGRNIFIDRYFTNFDLCTKLLDRNLTMTGTIMPSRRDVPKDFVKEKDREVHSTVELWEHEKRVMLLSYIPKKGKNVLMMSSMHLSAGVLHEREDKKPSVIVDYNHGKGGVDLLDSCIDDFTVKRKTNRYPLVIFLI